MWGNVSGCLLCIALQEVCNELEGVFSTASYGLLAFLLINSVHQCNRVLTLVKTMELV